MAVQGANVRAHHVANLESKKAQEVDAVAEVARCDQLIRDGKAAKALAEENLQVIRDEIGMLTTLVGDGDDGE